MEPQDTVREWSPFSGVPKERRHFRFAAPRATFTAPTAAELVQVVQVVQGKWRFSPVQIFSLLHFNYFYKN